MTKMIFTILMASFLSACATTEKYETALNTWPGNSVDDLVNVWGYPQNTFKAPNGNTVYEYRSSSTYVTPTYTNTNYNVFGSTLSGNTLTTGGQVINYSCQTFFEVDEDNVILRWQYRGNDCLAR